MHAGFFPVRFSSELFDSSEFGCGQRDERRFRAAESDIMPAVRLSIWMKTGRMDCDRVGGRKTGK